MYNLYLSVYLDFNDKAISGKGTIVVIWVRDPTIFSYLVNGGVSLSKQLVDLKGYII